MKEIKGKYLLVLIAMCGVIGASLGLTTNVTGVYITPVAEAFNVGKGTVSMTLTICNIVYSIGGILVAKMLNQKSYKKVALISAVLLTVSTAAMGLSTSIWMLYVFSAVRGLAAGILGIVFATMVINNWFVKNSGLATSIAFGCSGIVGAVFSPVLSSIISSAGWRMKKIVTEISLNKSIFLKTDDGFTGILISSIIYCEVLGRKLYLYDREGHSYHIFDMNLSELYEKIDNKSFVYVNRSVFVNISAIYRIDKEKVYLKKWNMPLYLSRSKNHEVHDAYEKYVMSL